MCISTVIITFQHVPSCTDEAWNAETCACLQIVLLRSFTSVLLSTLRSSWASISDNAKLTSLVVVRALWPHVTLRMSRSVGVTVLYHMRRSGESRFMCISTVIITFQHVPSWTDEAWNAETCACLQIVLYIHTYISFIAFGNYDIVAQAIKLQFRAKLLLHNITFHNLGLHRCTI